jgi:hypothetical protein
MSLSYSIDVERRAVVLTCGNASFERWRQTMREIFADPTYHAGFPILIDCRSATLTPSAAQVRHVIEFLAAHADALGDSCIAVVVAEQAAFGMARMAAILAETAGLNIAAFKEVDAANQWLAGRSPSVVTTPNAG